jgi:hypothetical protein
MKDYEHWILPSVRQTWCLLICRTVTLNYVSMVRDMLTSLRKTEDSLKKLKKTQRKEMMTLATSKENVQTSSLTDEEKILLQLSLDIKTFGVQLEGFDVNMNDFEPYRELQSLLPLSPK